LLCRAIDIENEEAHLMGAALSEGLPAAEICILDNITGDGSEGKAQEA
jgi:hypothetical protein